MTRIATYREACLISARAYSVMQVGAESFALRMYTAIRKGRSPFVAYAASHERYLRGGQGTAIFR